METAQNLHEAVEPVFHPTWKGKSPNEAAHLCAEYAQIIFCFAVLILLSIKCKHGNKFQKLSFSIVLAVLILSIISIILRLTENYTPEAITWKCVELLFIIICLIICYHLNSSLNEDTRSFKCISFLTISFLIAAFVMQNRIKLAYFDFGIISAYTLKLLYQIQGASTTRTKKPVENGDLEQQATRNSSSTQSNINNLRDQINSMIFMEWIMLSLNLFVFSMNSTQLVNEDEPFIWASKLSIRLWILTKILITTSFWSG